MPRYRRVTWQITAGSTTKATTIQSAISTALVGKSVVRMALALLKSGTLVSGDYLFTTPTQADSVYSSCVTQLQGANALSGTVSWHDCDHDANELGTMTGCVPGASTVR